MTRFIFFDNESSNPLDVQLIGGKCLQLARLRGANLNIPRWFCVTTRGFNNYLTRHNLLDLSKSGNLEELRAKILSNEIDGDLADETTSALKILFENSSSKLLAIRSSATMEDAKKDAFAGQFDTFLGIGNINDALESIKKCWASLWSSRSVTYLKRGENISIEMAVLVQEFVPADIAGVIFTVNPATKNETEIVIEASWGLGEYLVGGKITPDYYLMERDPANNSYMTKKKKRGSKKKSLEWDIASEVLAEKITSQEKVEIFTLNDEMLVELSNLAAHLAKRFEAPQDIEWAIFKNKVYLLQSRPITTI